MSKCRYSTQLNSFNTLGSTSKSSFSRYYKLVHFFNNGSSFCPLRLVRESPDYEFNEMMLWTFLEYMFSGSNNATIETSVAHLTDRWKLSDQAMKRKKKRRMGLQIGLHMTGQSGLHKLNYVNVVQRLSGAKLVGEYAILRMDVLNQTNLELREFRMTTKDF
jgi:hypothetical protein